MQVGSFGCHLCLPERHLQCSWLSATGRSCLSEQFLWTVWASKDWVNIPAANGDAGLAQRLNPCLLQVRVSLEWEGAAGDSEASVITWDCTRLISLYLCMAVFHKAF